MRAALLTLLLAPSACAYKLRVSSEPAAASLELPRDGGEVALPADISLRWAPFNHQPVVITAPGYRPLVVDLRKDEVRFGRYITDTIFHPSTLSGAARGHVRFVLVPLHGPVGTWDPEDVPR